MKKNRTIKVRTVLRRVFLILFLSVVCFKGKAYAQETVTGVITSSADGLPLIGATVQKLGTKAVTTTDFDGQYVIKATQGDILQFTYLGMTSKTLTIKGNVLNVILDPSQEQLDEVIVVGYGTVKKKEITGAVARVKAEDIENIVTSDLGSAIQGQVSGVNVVDSGEPGGDSDILIRGITSLTGSNEPLYVVDGVMQEGNPRIPPNVIESLDILKDAASTAIYGTRGAGGVILITTKQGKEGALKVTLNSSYGIQVINGTPTRLMNANEQLYSIMLQKRNSDGLGLADDQLNLGFNMFKSAYLNDSDLFGNVILNSRPTQNHSLTISGGGKEINYNVTAGFYRQKGTIVGSDFQRFNIRANTGYQKGKWDIKAIVAITNEENHKSPGGLTSQIIKYSPLNIDVEDVSLNDVIFTTGGSNGNNLQSAINSFRNENTINSLNANTTFSAVYKFTDNLSLTSRYGMSSDYDYGHSFRPYQQVINAVTGEEISQSRSSGVGNNAQKKINNTFSIFSNYKFNINKDHRIAMTLGATYEKYTTERFSAGGSGVTNNDIKVLNGTTLNYTVESGNDYISKTFGLLYRLQYNYQGKYIFSSSIRRDASSRFNVDSRSALFPSASFAWNVSDEGFWDDYKSVVNNFRIRASYGKVGNQRVGDYIYQQTFLTEYQYAYGRSGSDNLTNGNIQNGYANKDLKWETSIQSNLGVDLSFFKNKVTFTAEYYHKTNSDMLFPITLSGSTGAINNSGIILNVGNMTNKGLELATKYKTNIGNVKLNMSGTFTTNKNVITKLDGFGRFTLMDDSGLISGARDQSQVTAIAKGYEAGAFFIYTTDGVINTSEELADYQKINPQASMGDLVIVDTNNDGQITNDDRTYRGSGLPKYELGYNLNASYKSFDFSMNWYAALGQEIMNGSKATAFGYGRHADLINQWSEVNPTSSIPSFKNQIKNHYNYNGNTDLWLEDGSYLRLKAVTVGYSLSKSILEKLGGISRFRIYATAQNPLTFTKYTGYNPAVGGRIQSRGLDKGTYPITATYMLGLNLNF
ncbi:SusC/RagA family TonB-linked outer membrane protein [Wenyingzhuangia aestuarii]|uniref:SusC/RagA family TonB-linked outer membrane protein n=1 Tax=Wenyingzhuangia aestuarii TaxID=1647582 RepID=UPI00143C48F8|nr:TonB-dependent receptor [Wenyingzhuangia aestuarii]NJB81647.1 TonB-linked SusC/RagA family outer membrane protein [Wenyingzhuangia aestuarii]